MGCQNTTFKMRKRELAILTHDVVTDEDVVRSFRDSVDPAGKDPWMLNLIRVGQLAVILGPTLFVHAGVQAVALGLVPGCEKPLGTLLEWTAALNRWKDTQVAEFCSRPLWHQEGEKRHRGAEQLIDYGTPASSTPSVVYFNPFTNGNPTRIPPEAEDFLTNSGIMQVCSGHQPHGQAPAVVRHVRTNLLLLHCDTSYSDMAAPKILNSSDNRGQVCSVVRFVGSQVQAEGVLKGGDRHAFALGHELSSCSLPDALVGMQLSDESWIKTVTATGRVIAVRGMGFKLMVRELHPGQAIILLKREYRNIIDQLIPDLAEFTLNWISEHLDTFEDAPEALHGTTSLGLLHRQTSLMLLRRDEFLAADSYILGIDGIIAKLGNGLEQACVGKVNQLIQAGKRVVFLSTGVEYGMSEVEKKLRELGVQLPYYAKQDIVTTARCAAWFLALAKTKRPYVLCSGTGLLQELKGVGITDYVAIVDAKGNLRKEYHAETTPDNIQKLVQEAPDVDAVLVGDNKALSALSLSVAAAYLKWNRDKYERTIPLVSCGLENDRYLGHTHENFCKKQGFNGRVLRSVGANVVATALCQMVEVGQEVINVGKPSTFLAELLRRAREAGGYGVDFSRTIMVGHQLETDIAFASSTGMKSLLVLSGATTKSHLDALFGELRDARDARTAQIPTWVVPSLADV